MVAVEQFIAFHIDEREYCVDIRAVQEIRGWSPATPIPNAPRHVLGIIDLRGSIVPIVDLRASFGGGSSNPGNAHVVVIVRIDETVVGLLVDGVSDILSAAPELIQETPDLHGGAGRLVPRIVNQEGRLLGILDLAQLVDADQIRTVAAGVS